MDESEKKKLNDIHSALVGDDSLGHEGLIKKVNRHEAWINSASLKVAGILGGAAVLGILAKIIFKI